MREERKEEDTRELRSSLGYSEAVRDVDSSNVIYDEEIDGLVNEIMSDEGASEV